MSDMTKLSSIFASLAIVLALVGCGNSSTGSSHTATSAGTTSEARPVPNPQGVDTPTKHIVINRLSHLGIVLTNGKGHPLYAFVPDKHGAATCTGSCAAVWPPFQLTNGEALDTSPLLAESQFTLQPDPEGGHMVKYEGWLLHTYVGDTSPGVANGQGASAYGGLWHVISAAGKLVTTKRWGVSR
jgi:predicted lipoprotein with Yx(FWY)xxD motif